MVQRIFQLAGVFVLLALLMTKWKSDPVQVVAIDEEVRVQKKHRQKTSQRRSPASIAQKNSFILKESERKIALNNEQEFDDREAEPLLTSPTQSSGYIPQEQAGPFNRSASTPVPQVNPKTQTTPDANSPKIFSNQGFPSGTPTASGTAQTPTKSSGPSSGNSSPEPLSCSASIGAGTYSSPRTVAITCTSSAVIRYCLQENTCCDPSTGANYTGPFTVGVTVGDFCLSIQGENEEGPVLSDVAQIDLKFNPDVPHLVVAHQRRYWQTGQLSAQMSFVSDNFGSPNLEAGILNLLTHDTSPSGLNMSCEQIVENYTTLTTPSPLVIMPGLAVDSLSSSVQLDAWLTSSQLNYGDNNVTTYLRNNNYGSESFACSTTKLVVEDFDYFTAEAPEAVSAVSLDGYLLGGLSTYGHFEEDPVLNRSPAGSMIDVSQDQELRTGMLGIFF